MDGWIDKGWEEGEMGEGDGIQGWVNGWMKEEKSR